MKYQIQTATNPEELTQKVNAQLQTVGENWKLLGGVQIQAMPARIETSHSEQTGISVIFPSVLFVQSLVDYEDKYPFGAGHKAGLTD